MEKSVESSQNTDDIVNLLENALKDFGNAKTSDDDLDDFMSTYDREASLKAAKNFHNMLEKMAKTTLNENKPVENQAAFDVGALNETDENFMKEIQKLLGQSKDLTNMPDEKSFLDALQKMEEDSPAANQLMSTILHAALSKDVMYSAVKEMNDKYKSFLTTEKKKELEETLLLQYEKQHEIINKLQKEYEKEEGTSNPPDKQSTRISQLWMKLQSHGLPPQEIAATTPGLDVFGENDAGGVLPESVEGCSIM